MRSSVFSACAGPLHQLEHARAAVLERDVEVGQHLALGHQRDHLVHVRVRIDVVQAYPGAERAERTREIREARLHRLAAPEARRVLEVGAVGAGVLRDHQQFLDAGLHQALGLEHHLADRPAREVAAHRGDDAEACSGDCSLRKSSGTRSAAASGGCPAAARGRRTGRAAAAAARAPR